MYSLGLDLGTSAARASLIDEQRQEIWSGRTVWRDNAFNPASWRQALLDLLAQVPPPLRAQTGAMALDATSGTVLLTDAQLRPVSEVLPYNHPLNADPAAKLAWLKPGLTARHFMHQADYCNSILLNRPAATDYHNALKSGFDPHTMQWLAGIYTAAEQQLLPAVVSPGSPLGQLSAELAQPLGYPVQCVVRAGTTDSIAAFLAAGADQAGSAVSSLGSTLVLKLLSKTPVKAAEYGIYSHKLGALWLAGGASNTGGAVLSHFFTAAQLASLSAHIPTDIPSPLDYYPLLKPGERFPINDPHHLPRLTTRPTDDTAFLHGMLEGIARIEQQGYARLVELGATPPTRILSCGGGSQNPAWTAIRQRRMCLPVSIAPHSEAAYGSALLAAQGPFPE